MGKFGSTELGRFRDDYKEYDDPNLNKCPKCGALTEAKVCPICHAEIPIEMQAGHRSRGSSKNQSMVKHDGRGIKVVAILSLFACVFWAAVFILPNISWVFTDDTSQIQSYTTEEYIPEEYTPPVTTAAPLPDVRVTYIQTTVTDTFFGKQYTIALTVENDTDITLNLDLDSIALNGTSFNDFYTDDSIAPHSEGVVHFNAYELLGGDFSKFPTEILESVNGEMSYINEYGEWEYIKFSLGE